MDADDLCFAGAAEQARLVRTGEVSAVELTRATLDRIERVDPTINSYRVILADQAMADARAIDERRVAQRDLPLLGVPVGVKDNNDVRGEITAWGSDANSVRAEDDSPIVAALRAAGAVIVGKTNCSELSVWPFTENETWGATRNPWNIDFSPGGSSGGSGAAVAAGLCGLATASDGLGSIRGPAGFCGVFGLKPQRDRVWHRPGGWHGLSVNGPIARHVADAALFLDAVAPIPGGSFVPVSGVRRALRIAVAYAPALRPPFSARPGDEQHEAVRRVAGHLRDLGHHVFDRELDFAQSAQFDGMTRYISGVGDDARTVEHEDRLTPMTATIARLGRRIPGRMVASARRREPTVAQKLNRIFESADVVLTPGAVAPPLRIGETRGMGGLATLRRSGRVIPHYGVWNIVGQPAASVPAGFDAHGLPLSVQLAGRPHDESTLLQLTAELESTLGWNEHRPTL